MSSSSKPRLQAYKAGGALKPYSFVKWGSSKEYVVQCGANEKPMGIYQGDKDAAAEDGVEVALPGGGAKLKVSEIVNLGTGITCTASEGKGEEADAAGEWVGAVAYENAEADGDIIGVEVMIYPAYASEA